MIYDIVLCVHQRDAGIAVKAINSLHHFLESRNIFLITKEDVFSDIENKVREPVTMHFLDEANLSGDLTLQKIKDTLQEKMGIEIYPNWYYQQFLKMAVAQLPEVSDHFLIWDSDTVLLRPISFFDDNGTILFNPQKENHSPYFEWIKDVLGIEKQVDYSFVDHNLMIKKSYMNELIEILQEKAPEGKTWYWQILDAIKNEYVTKSGFSEFETYGNFVMWRYPGSYKPRSLNCDRGGTRRFGRNPGLFDFFILMDEGVEVCTFESWHRMSVIKVAFRKIKARLYYRHCVKKGLNQERIRDAHAIAG